MQGRKIVLRTQSIGKASSDDPTTGGNSEQSGTAHVSQSLKTTAAGKRPRATEQLEATSELVLLLRRKDDNEPVLVPSVCEISTFASQNIAELERSKIRSIPDRFQPRNEVGDATGEIYALIAEQRSAPPTPLHKTKSLDKNSKHEHEEKTKNEDIFDEELDSLFILALELKELTKDFLPERDSTQLETKLEEYLTSLRKLEQAVKDESVTDSDRTRKEQPVMMETWKAIDAGVHPDAHLLEQSEQTLNLAQQNVKSAMIIGTLLEVGNSLSKRHKRDPSPTSVSANMEG